MHKRVCTAPVIWVVYEDRILPYLIHLSMRPEPFAAYRRRLFPGAEGRVLEIGIGSGLNLPFYGSTITEVIGLDPSLKLLSIVRATLSTTPSMRLLKASAEEFRWTTRALIRWLPSGRCAVFPT